VHAPDLGQKDGGEHLAHSVDGLDGLVAGSSLHMEWMVRSSRSISTS
jgi:hypothetical protein